MPRTVRPIAYFRLLAALLIVMLAVAEALALPRGCQMSCAAAPASSEPVCSCCADEEASQADQPAGRFESPETCRCDLHPTRGLPAAPASSFDFRVPASPAVLTRPFEYPLANTLASSVLSRNNDPTTLAPRKLPLHLLLCVLLC